MPVFSTALSLKENLHKRSMISSSTWIHDQEKLTQFKEDTLRSVIEEHQRPGNVKKEEESDEHRQRADAQSLR